MRSEKQHSSANISPSQGSSLTPERPMLTASATASTPSHEQRPRRIRWIAVAVFLVVAVLGVLIANPFSSARTNDPGVGNADSTGLGAIIQRDLSSQTQVSATLGYAGSYAVVNQAQGTVTSLPAVGQVVREGQVLYDVSESPVALLYGTTPAFRTLSEGTTDSATSGADVENLNYDLVALGYLTSADVASAPSDFTAYTKSGVEKLQAALGMTEDGVLALGQVVFLPSAARITSVTVTLGSPAQPGQSVLSATSTDRQVNIALDAALQSDVDVGDKVTISLPNNETTPGVISSVGTVASSSSGSSSSGSSGPTIRVLVNPTDPAATGTWDQTQVNVTITTGTVTNALVVPVDALLAQPGGGYAVEVVDPNGTHHLADVTLGLFDDADGLVQVSGSGLSAGQHIVVPKI